MYYREWEIRGSTPLSTSLRLVRRGLLGRLSQRSRLLVGKRMSGKSGSASYLMVETKEHHLSYLCRGSLWRTGRLVDHPFVKKTTSRGQTARGTRSDKVR